MGFGPGQTMYIRFRTLALGAFTHDNRVLTAYYRDPRFYMDAVMILTRPFGGVYLYLF